MRSAGNSDRPGRDRHEGDDTDVVHLFMRGSEDRRLLVEHLEETYDVRQGVEDPQTGAVDLWVVDAEQFRTDADRLAEFTDDGGEDFVPVLLVDDGRGDLRADPTVWDRVDDVVETPVRRAELGARVSNLLERRRTSRRLADRTAALEHTVAELERKERAMDAAPVGITITDPGRPDNPVVYANAAFERITGYDREAAVGRNMRFLQGPATDEEAVRTLREGIAARERVSATLINYRADGSRFWNRVDIAPVRDESGDVVNFVGFQTEVTEEKIREQRLSVLNRMMRHNLSNDVNVVAGYAQNLRDDLSDPDRLAAVGRIERAARKLEKLGDDVRRVEQTIGTCRRFERRVDVGDLLARLRERTADRFPDAEFDLDVEGGPWRVTGGCLEEVFEELLENAVVHTDAAEPRVSITVGPVPDSEDQVNVRIADNGPGIPDELVDVFRSGEETQLKHGDGLGLWVAHWGVTLMGGDIRLSTDDGTVVTVVLRVADGPDA